MPANIFEARADRMDKGLNLNTDRNLEFGEIADGRALRFERGIGIMTGPGFLHTGTILADNPGEGSLEATVIRPTAWVKCGTKIKYTHDGVSWYDTGVTLTSGYKQGFVEQGNGDVLTSNQTDANIVFAVGILKVALAAGDVIINVGAKFIDKFAASGSVVINGVTYTYSGKSTPNLTGVQQGGGAVTTAQSINSLVVQQRTQSTWTEEKGTILLKFQSRCLVMNVKDNENIVYYSAIEDLANPQFFYDFDGNGAYQKELPGRITGGIAGIAGGYIFMDRGVQQIVGFDDTSGALITKEISSEEGAYNQDCVKEIGGVVYFMGRKRFTPITLTLDPSAEAAPYLGSNFDHKLRPWFESHDDQELQTSAFLKTDTTQNIIKMGAVVNGALETYVHDNQNPGFLPKENRSVGTSFMLNGKSYFVHRDNGKCYEDDMGRTNDGVPISHLISTGQIENDKGRSFMKGQYLSYEGWMTQGTLHKVRVYLGGASEHSYEEEYSYEDLIDLGKKRSIGLRGIGLSTLGGSAGGVALVYAYQNDIVIRGLNEDSFRVEWEITGEGNFMSINTWYLSAHPTPRQPRTKN